MLVLRKECIHCGSDYMFQASGSYDALDIPYELQHPEYCPECKGAINNALLAIPKKFAYRNVPTNEVSLETLLEWEKINKEEEKQKGGLIAVRVLVGLFKENGESQRVREVIGRDEFKGRVYIYCYWPSNMSDYTITVEKKINLQTNEELSYRIKK